MTSTKQAYKKPLNMSDTNSNSKAHYEMDVDIVLGMPSKDCQSFGICKIQAVSDTFLTALNRADNRVKAQFHHQKNQKLIIKFLIESITEKAKLKYFRSEFIILEEVTTPEFVNDFFGKSFTIRKGNYEIKKGKKYYTIVL